MNQNFRFNNPKQCSNWMILVSFCSSHLAIKNIDNVHFMKIEKIDFSQKIQIFEQKFNFSNKNSIFRPKFDFFFKFDILSKNLFFSFYENLQKSIFPRKKSK